MSLFAWGDDGGADDPVHPDTLLEAGWWPSEDAEEALALMRGVLAARGSLVTLEVHLAKLRAFVEAHGPGVVLTPEPDRPMPVEEIGAGMSDKTIFVSADCSAVQAITLRGPYADAYRCPRCGAATRDLCTRRFTYPQACAWGDRL